MQSTPESLFRMNTTGSNISVGGASSFWVETPRIRRTSERLNVARPRPGFGLVKPFDCCHSDELTSSLGDLGRATFRPSDLFNRLRKKLFHPISVDVGEPKVSSTIPIDQFFVVETQQVEHRGVQVMQVDSAICLLYPSDAADEEERVRLVCSSL